jgi:hypothetical protein
MMSKKVKKIAIVMDEVDGMNNGDKGGITSLIKLIRQKKTKKQKTENSTMNPIICIGNYNIDKKIKELMKVCNVFELKPVTNSQIGKLLSTVRNVDDVSYKQIVDYIQGDLRKLYFIESILLKKPELLNSDIFSSILQSKSHHDDSKVITKLLINKPVIITNHTQFMNETERTIVALLYHENIVDPIFSSKTNDNITKYNVYSKIMENICYADHIDRITFQNQIWVFNEMSSLVKTFHNNMIYHDSFQEMYKPEEVRFTKVLTKYSTEYNNQTFIYNLCQELDMDKKDMMSFFQEKRLLFKSDYLSIVEKLLDETSITKLDIKRIYRYLDKNVKNDVDNDDFEIEASI